jgi:hypothetical protein
MALESSITKTAEGLYELCMNGRLHRPHWVVQLFAALSQLHVSVCSGYAAQEQKGEWRSKFVLDFSRSTADPLQLDYRAFSELTASGDRTCDPKLTRFEITRRPDHLLQVQVEGPDQMGFLATILSRIAILALFPTSIKIDLEEGQFRDAIVLRGFGDQGPSETASKTLDRMLRTFLL